MKKVVTYVVSRNMYHLLRPSIESLVKHTPVDCIYVFIEDDVFPYLLPKKTKLVNMAKYKLLAKGPNLNNSFTWMVMLRVAYSKMISDAKILNLDMDTIVVDDISPLWDIDMSDSYAMMCQEYLGNYRPYGDKYYNCGVAMLDLERIKADKLDDKMLKLINTKELPYPDQDVINELMQGRITDMPVRFNECFATGRTDNPAIVHYAGIKHWWDAGYDEWKADESQQRLQLYRPYGFYE